MESPSSVETSAENEYFAFPTTLGQQRFWALDSLQPGNSALNMPLGARLQGPLDRAAAQNAVNEVARRHEILRTRFQKENDDLVQIVGPAFPIPIHWTELHGITDQNLEKKTREFMLAEAQRPFDLSKGPLLRASIVSFGPTEHLLLLSMHHIGCDGWSNGLLIQEFATLYTHFLLGEPLPIDPPLQYADYAIWQKDWLTAAGGQKQREYWKNLLGTDIPALNLPTDKPRGAKPTVSGDIHSLLLSHELTERLRSLAQREGATPFMVVLAAYVMLLFRYSNRREFVVGSPAACRNQTELEGLIGLFANPVLFYVKLHPQMSFRELLLHVKDTTLASFANQEYPFELIAEGLQTRKDRRGVPWLQAYFVFQKAFMQPQEMPNLHLTPIRSVSSGVMFEWMLGVIERKEGVRLQLEYCTDLYAGETIDRALSHLGKILDEASTNAEFQISQFSLDPRQEPRATPSLPTTQPRLITRLASGPANRILVEQNGRQLSIETLLQTAKQLSLALEPGRAPQRIGIPIANTPDAVAAVLATLDAGHVAVCLSTGATSGDPSSVPVDFLWSMQSDRLELARPQSAAGENEAANSSAPDLVPGSLCLPTTAAGLVHEHVVPSAEFFEHATALAEILPLNEGERVYAATPLNSLPGWEDLFAVILSGGTFVHGRLDQGRFNAQEALTAPVWMLHSAAWQEWLRPLEPAAVALAMARVHLLVLTGEPLAPKAMGCLQSLGEARPDLALRYCPREFGMTVAVQRISRTSEVEQNSPPHPIGRALGACSLDVVDSQGIPVPRGLPGRLKVNVPWLSSKERKESALVTDAWVRIREKESMEWLGQNEDLARTDSFSTELAQLREIACRHPEIWDAQAVTTLGTGTATVTLHAVALPQRRLAPHAVQQHIRHLAPAYMIPAVVVHEHTPLAASGDWDFAALREIHEPTQWDNTPAQHKPTSTSNAEDREDADGSARAQTTTEEKVAKLFSSVLRLPEIDVEQSFFELGGHSLLAVRLFAEIEKEFGKRLPLASLLNHPSARRLSALIDSSNDNGNAWPCLVPMATQGNGPKFFCVHGAGGNVLLYRDLARHMSPAARFYGLQARGLDGKTKCLTRVEEMAALYLEEIVKEQPIGPYFIGGYCLGGNIAFEIGRQLHERGQPIGMIAMLDTYNLNRSLYTGSLYHLSRKWIEKTGFHLNTFWRLSHSDRKRYVGEKGRMAVELVRGKTKALLRGIRRTGESSLERGAGAFVQDANHIALRAHDPEPSPAPLTLFQPRVNYSYFPDPEQGWRELVGGRIEKVVLSANPHAMLIQPFVRELAEAIVQRMQSP